MRNKKPKSKAAPFVICFELFEANKIMSLRNQSAFRHNVSRLLYQRVYKGSGIRLLMTNSSSKHSWLVEYKTTGYDVDTSIPVLEPHVMQLTVSGKCSASAALLAVSSIWHKEIMPEVTKQRICPTQIFVKLKTLD